MKPFLAWLAFLAAESLVLIALARANVRNEVDFNRFSVCIQSDAVGGVNKVVVAGAIDLDNGNISRVFSYDVYNQLTTNQQTTARNIVLTALQVVSNKEQVPSPTPTVTATSTALTPTPTRSPTPTITSTP